MRLNKDLGRQATEELLEILARHPNGLPTHRLIGTPRFRGMRILTPRQVAQLLRASGRVNEQTKRYGSLLSQTWWTLRDHQKAALNQGELAVEKFPPEDLSKLSYYEAKVLELRQGLHSNRQMPFEQVAAALGKSVEEVKGIEISALRRLRQFQRERRSEQPQLKSTGSDQSQPARTRSDQSQPKSTASDPSAPASTGRHQAKPKRTESDQSAPANPVSGQAEPGTTKSDQPQPNIKESERPQSASTKSNQTPLASTRTDQPQPPRKRSLFENTNIWLELSARNEKLFHEVWKRIPQSGQALLNDRLRLVTDQGQAPNVAPGQTRFFPDHCEVSLQLDGTGEQTAKFVIARELVHAMFDDTGMTDEEKEAADTIAEGIATQFGFAPEENQGTPEPI